ncbi:hypothetical protein PFISCL1PPCAC_4330, partial [Pristionchus fissidentatus]
CWRQLGCTASTPELGGPYSSTPSAGSIPRLTKRSGSILVGATVSARSTTNLANCLTIIIYLGSAAVVGHLFDSPTSARSLAY